MTRRKKIKKNETEVFEVVDDKKGLGRLSDMDTKELSLVDRAANQRKFLVVKRDENGELVDEEGNPAEASPSGESPPEPNNEEDPPVTKKLVKARVDEALGRVQAIKTAVSEAPTAEKSTENKLPVAVGREMRSCQFMLKGIAGIAKGVALLVPGINDLTDVEPIEAAVKKGTDKVLGEVERRLTKVSEALTDETEILDADQIKKVDATADLIAKALRDYPVQKNAIVVVRESLTDEDHETVVSEVQKAIEALTNLYVDLHTDRVDKTEKIAGEFEIGDMLHEAAAGVESAVAKLFIDKTAKRAITAEIIENVRTIEKVVINNPETLSDVSERVVEIAKAATIFETRWAGDGKTDVILRTSDEVVATFDTWEEAKLEALKRNVEMVTGVAKADIKKRFVVRTGGKGYQVVDEDTEKVVWDGESEAEAKQVAQRMNFEALAKKNDESGEGDEDTENKDTSTQGTEGETSETKDGDSPTEEDDVGEGKKTETSKVGSPMKANRLKRLKETVKLLLEGIGDLQGGSVPLEKFKKVGSTLAEIINEVSAKKSMGATAGVEDKRPDNDPNDPNQGSGVQPDSTSRTGAGDDDGVVGEGVPDGVQEIIKRAVEEATAPMRDEVTKLKAENVKLKKSKAAPSVPPEDAVESRETVPAGGKDEGDPGYWPADMADPDAWK